MPVTAVVKKIRRNLKEELSASAFVTTLLIAGCAFAANPPTENQEYGFRATIPEGLPICLARSDTHVHGVGTVLVGTDCANRNRVPAFSIWADFNASFVMSALDGVKDNPICSQSRVTWAEGQWTGALGGLRTAMCRVDHPDGTVDIVLETQAGNWPQGFNEDSPHINYVVYFNSTTARLNNDLQLLDGFLKSIQIFQPAP